jgi:hypothetical protein
MGIGWEIVICRRTDVHIVLQEAGGRLDVPCIPALLLPGPFLQGVSGSGSIADWISGVILLCIPLDHGG